MAMSTLFRREAALPVLVTLLALHLRNASAQTETCPADKAAYCNKDTATAAAATAGCYNTSTSASACGNCSTVCPYLQPCAKGTCACPADNPSYCGTDTAAAKARNAGCYNFSSSAYACGNCSTVCPYLQPCADGTCACPADTPGYCGTDTATAKSRNAGCYNFSSNAYACGNCSTVCPYLQPCANGTCACPADNPGYCGTNTATAKARNAGCYNFSSSAYACGNCSTVCPSNQPCANGTCACPADTPGYCGTDTATAKARVAGCYNFSSSPYACGNCSACPTNQPCANGTCACPADTPGYCGTDTATAKARVAGCYNFSSSPYACGNCSTVCPDYQPCANGTCACPADTTGYCGSGTATAKARTPGCYNLSSSTFACGSCNNVCLTGQSCANGTCVCPADTTGYCGSDTATAKARTAGCYNLSSSTFACGNCSNVCPSGQICTNGTCVCPAESPTYCGKDTNAAKVSTASCYNTNTSRYACGSCNMACSPGIDCIGGFCGPRSDGVPIDPSQPSLPTTPAPTPTTPAATPTPPVPQATPAPNPAAVTRPPPPPPAAPAPRSGVSPLPPLTAPTPAALPPAKSSGEIGLSSSGQAPAQSPSSAPVPNTGLLICLPVGLSFASNTSANGVVLNQTCAVLSNAQAASTPTPAIAASGRRLQQVSGGETYQRYFPSPGSNVNSVVLTFYVPLNLFSLTAIQSAPSGNYSVGPRLTDPRVLLAASIFGDCSAKGRVDVYKLQAALSAASDITNDTSKEVSPAAAQALADLEAVDVCPLFTTSAPAPGSPSASPQASALSPSAMVAAAAPNITELGKAFNPGLGSVNGPLIGAPYTFPDFISAVYATAWTNSSGCGSAPAVGTGQALQLCLQIQIRASAFPPSTALSPSPAQARSGVVQTCNVEVEVRSFVPYMVVYGPPTALSADPTAFNGNNRNFSYNNGSSVAELLGSFTITGQDFSDAPRVQSGQAMFQETVQYLYRETVSVGGSQFEGRLSASRPTILQRATLQRTPSNLVLHGLGGASSGIVQVHLDGGNPLLRFAPNTLADVQISFTSSPTADGSGYNYFYSLDGNIDNFPSFELYINRVLAYSSTARTPSYLPSPSAVSSSKNIPTARFALPGCPRPTSCGTVNTPLTASGGQSPIEDVRYLQVAGNATIQLQYDSYTIPDRFYVLSIPDNAVLYDTAWVGAAGQCANIPGLQVSGPGGGNQRVTVPPGKNTVAVVVDSPCEDTRWTYTVACVSIAGK